MARKSEHDGLRLDEAARAGWRYYVAGNTQDEIARKLGISRQAAQRLVSLAISERLIKVRLDHPIARCMELAAALKLRYDLRFCEVAPTDPGSTSSTLGIAQVAAAEFERHPSGQQMRLGRVARAKLIQPGGRPVRLAEQWSRHRADFVARLDEHARRMGLLPGSALRPEQAVCGPRPVQGSLGLGRGQGAVGGHQ